MDNYNELKDGIDDMATKFSDVNLEGEDSYDDIEFIPLAAMPNDKLPEIVIPLNMENYDFEIVSLQSPSYFYIHLLKSKEIFFRFCEDINGYYNKLGSDSISPALELPLGSHWCVYYSEMWLRAKVTKNMGMQYSDEHKLKDIHFEMLFVDFGFRDVVSFKNINTLNEEFMCRSPFAIPCCLAEVYPISKWEPNPWSEEAINFFKAYFFNMTKCVVTILELNGANTFEVVLEINDIVINEDLVLKGFAESSFIASISNGNINLDSAITLSETLKVDKCLEDSWNPMEEDFFDERNTVHLDDTCAETVTLGIQNKDESILCKFFSKGRPCPRGEVCKWPHIIARKDGLPTVSESVYCNLQCNLNLPQEGTFLKAVVTVIFSPDNFYINICGLGSDQKCDVITELQNDLSGTYCKKGGVHEISIPSVGELMVIYKSEGELTGFHRVRVLSVIETENFNVCEVFYIDYGITEQVSQKILRKLTNQFLRPPAQALHCYLEDVLPLRNDWQNSDPASSLFQEVTKNKIVTVVISTVNDYDEKVGLLIVDPDNEENTVNELIVSAGLGVMKK